VFDHKKDKRHIPEIINITVRKQQDLLRWGVCSSFFSLQCSQAPVNVPDRFAGKSAIFVKQKDSSTYSFCVAHPATLEQVERRVPQELKVLVSSFKKYTITKAIN
jgi:hypothetical protein